MSENNLFSKIIYIFLIFVCAVAVFIGVQKLIELDKQKKMEIEEFRQKVITCKNDLDKKMYSKAAACYSDLIEKQDKSEFRYNFGVALLNKKRFGEALEQFKYVLLHETENQTVILSAKKQIKSINKKTCRKNDKHCDIGHYYTKDSEVAVWPNPKNISVYIGNDYNKEQLIKKAFNRWDERLYGIIDFKYTTNPELADITAVAVDIKDLLKQAHEIEKSDDSVGLTMYKTYYYNLDADKKYLRKAKIMISYNNLQKQKRADDEFVAITLHEIGHSIGILSHSDKYGDIMYPDERGQLYDYYSLSNRDVNTVRKIYGNI